MSVTYIVGAGGIGCAVGYGLVTHQFEVQFVDVDRQKIDYGNRHGLLGSTSSRVESRFIHFDDWHPEQGDVVILCTKCYDNSTVLKRIPHGVEVVSAQNGYDPELERFEHPSEMIVSYVVQCDPGTTRFRITRRGDLHFGPRGGESLSEFGLAYVNTFWDATVVVDDIRPIKATKLMYNAAISPIAAAAGLDNGALLSEPKAQKLFFDLIQENYRILTAANIPLGKVGPFHPRTVSKILKQRWLAKLMAKRFERSLRGTYCSMAGEIEKGRTELDNYSGHLLRLAGDTIPAPINRRVYDVVSRMTRERIPPHRGVIDELSS